MEHWSNINSTYGRLSSASGISPNASGLNPFDHVMDQRNFGNSGFTSGLVNPLPAHAVPLPPAHLTNIPHPVNYGALHGSMTPLFDAFGTSGFSNQTPYRPVGQALYSFDAVGSHADTMSRLASVISSQPSRSSSLFNSDLHVMNDSAIQGLASSAESNDFWPRSGFMPAAGVGPSSFIGMPSSSTSGGAKKDPPPAHSGSRPTPAAPAKTRFSHESPYVTQQNMKNEFAQRTSLTQLSRSLASSPPTAHLNCPRFESQRFYDGRSGFQPMTTANDQRYIESALQMDLNDVMSSDDTSSSLVGHNFFGGCSPTTFSSTGFPMVQKIQAQTAFQPAAELSSSPDCLGESRLHATNYGSLAANSIAIPASYAEFGVRKDYTGIAAIRTAGSGDAACGKNINREESFVPSGLLGSAAAQPSIANLLTVQAIADSTTKPKKSVARVGRSSRTGRVGRATGLGFDNEDDNLLGGGLSMSDGRRGRGAKSRRASENRGAERSETKLEDAGRYAASQLVGSPSGANSSAVFTQSVAPGSHLSGSLLQHSESYAYGPVVGSGKQVNDAQLFMTNVCGNSFVNPNELLINTNATGNDASDYNGSVNYEDAAKLNKPVVVDEEFTHLTEALISDDLHSHQIGTNCSKSEARMPAAKTNFLASFVSFLSGKKPETLSSVSNVAVCSRPVLPKYIPDPCPKKKEETVERAATSDSQEKSKTEELKADKVSPGGMSETVLVIADSAGPTSKSKDNNKRSVLKSEEDFSKVKTNRALTAKANSTPVRPQPTRRAKTAVEEKRRSLLDSDDSSDDELKRKSRSRNRHKDNDDYDSDKDPAWKPERVAFQIGRKRTNYDNDDESITPSKRTQNRRYSANDVASCASPPVAPVLVEATRLPETKPAVASSDSLSPGGQLLPSTSHLYQKGNFVIEKKDLKNLSSSFSIWKIDSGRLLQKFEPVMRDGKLTHQAISTYSSWSDDIKENYSAIKVNVVVASRSQEIVEVVGDIKTGMESSIVSSELLLEPFNIFIQILLSQSLEPNFLDALLQDPDLYYMGPLAKIEAAIELGLNQLKKASKWSKEFRDVADKMPNFSLLGKLTDSDSTCQATEDAAVPAVVCVRFSGTAYDSQTLKSLVEAESCKEIAVGEWTRQRLPTYHGLRHLKFTFYQKCKAKMHELKNGSDMEDHQLLDSCLQDLTWMKELFTGLECLLKEANCV